MFTSSEWLLRLTIVDRQWGGNAKVGIYQSGIPQQSSTQLRFLRNCLFAQKEDILVHSALAIDEALRVGG
eukprot:scaffold4504_cov128-Cylindrotheca_fusiformis.AAC.1